MRRPALSHTYNPRAVAEVRLNGVVTGEAGINALVAAHYGVPIVLVTGDKQACDETAELLPGIHQAVVKDTVSRMAAESLHPTVACALIRSAATDAVAAAASIGAPPLAADATLELDVRTTDIAEAMTWVRGVDRVADRTVRISGADRLSTFRSFAAAILLTRTVAELR